MAERGALAVLPPGDIPLALLTFNLGVEVGQLIFIACVLAILACAKRVALSPAIERAGLTAATYAIGILAAFWFIERMAQMVA